MESVAGKSKIVAEFPEGEVAITDSSEEGEDGGTSLWMECSHPRRGDWATLERQWQRPGKRCTGRVYVGRPPRGALVSVLPA